MNKLATKHKIAVIPGDGIGKEVVPEGLRVLDARPQNSMWLSSGSTLTGAAIITSKTAQ